jgi:hypothetical protein
MGDKNMKNKLKIMIVALLSMVIVTGCGTKSPTEVVNDYFNEIKKGENAEVTEYLLENIESTEDSTESNDETSQDPKIEEAMKLYLSKLDAKVLSENIDKDKATVEVELSGLNFSNIILEILQESISNVFSGVEMSDEDMSNSILEKVKSGKVETRTGNITLSKVDKEWKINTDDESFMGLIFGKAHSQSNSGAK